MNNFEILEMSSTLDSQTVSNYVKLRVLENEFQLRFGVSPINVQDFDFVDVLKADANRNLNSLSTEERKIVQNNWDNRYETVASER